MCDSSPPKVIVYKPGWNFIYLYSNDPPSLLLSVKAIEVDECYEICPKMVIQHIC